MITGGLHDLLRNPERQRNQAPDRQCVRPNRKCRNASAVLPTLHLRFLAALPSNGLSRDTPQGYTWQRTEPPTVSGSTVTAVFTSVGLATVVDTESLQFMFEGEPECVLYNGVGGPDNGTAVAASPFFVSLSAAGAPTM